MGWHGGRSAKRRTREGGEVGDRRRETTSGRTGSQVGICRPPNATSTSSVTTEFAMLAGSSNDRLISAWGSHLVGCLRLDLVPITDSKTVFSASGG